MADAVLSLVSTAGTRDRFANIIALSDDMHQMHQDNSGVVANADLATIIPRRPALRHARHFDLAIAEWADDLPRPGIWAHWSWRVESDPGHAWLRRTLADLYRAAGGSPA